MKTALLRGLAVAAMIFVLAGCRTKEAGIKNVIYLIGDGMGPQQIGLLMEYARYAPRSVVADRRPNLERLAEKGETGLVLTNAWESLDTDSAAAATQLASGAESRPEMLGTDKDGNSVESILEKARALGKSTGLISDSRITYATPAAFVAHRIGRGDENEIAVDLLAAGPDVMLSGGLRHWLPKDVNDDSSAVHQKMKTLIPSHIGLKSKRADGRDLIEEARGKGYAVVFTKEELERSPSRRILGLFAESAMPDGITVARTKDDPGRKEPTVAEMTDKALQVLSQNPKGFFLMVECNNIDWSNEHNDAGSLLHDLLNFDEAIGVVMDWAEKRGDTLVVLTADHESGSFGFSHSNYQIPAPLRLAGTDKPYKTNWNYGNFETLDKIFDQRMSFANIRKQFEALPKEQQTPEKFVEIFNANVEFKIDLAEAEAILAPRKEDYYAFVEEIPSYLMARAIAKEQQTTWGTGTHTSTPVPIFAWGPESYAGKYDGMHHATDIGRLTKDALK